MQDKQDQILTGIITHVYSDYPYQRPKKVLLNKHTGDDLIYLSLFEKQPEYTDLPDYAYLKNELDVPSMEIFEINFKHQELNNIGTFGPIQGMGRIYDSPLCHDLSNPTIEFDHCFKDYLSRNTYQITASKNKTLRAKN
jgi:hypothetical protein